jgi:hypothetical protein
METPKEPGPETVDLILVGPIKMSLVIKQCFSIYAQATENEGGKSAGTFFNPACG